MYRRTFVGREAELRQLQHAFDAALSGQGSLIAVVGEPGIGKTALCEQISTYVAVRGGKTLVGHCYEEGSLSLPYLPFIEALRPHVLSRDPAGLKEDLGSGAAEVARIISEVRDRLPVDIRPASTDPDEDRWRLYQAVVGFLRNASTVQPLLIVLEDLHWADRGTLDLLVFLARQLDGTRLLIVGNYRDVEVDRAHPLSGILAELRRGKAFLRVPLRGLTADEVQRMMSAIAGQNVSWSLAEAVHRQTEGNPLFVQEVLRYLAEEGLVSRDDGRWQRTGNTPLEMQIPEGLRDVIGKRLSRLSPECNRVLALAAVIGRDFALETLRGLGLVPEETLVEALEEAVHVGVLEEQTGLGGAVRYRFGHAFFRQTLYEELSAPRRIQLHQQVARALEEQCRDRLAEHAAELAEHFAHSSDRADLARAVAYSERAAQRAEGVYAYGEAARLYAQALDVQEVLDPNDRPKRFELLLKLGEALSPAGDPGRAADEVAPEALRVAESLNDNARVIQVCELAVDATHRRLGSGAVMTDSYFDWIQRLDALAPPATRARAHADCLVASVARPRGQQEEADERVLRSLELARALNEPEVLFRAAGSALFPSALAARLDIQRELAREIVAHPRDGVRMSTLALVLERAPTFLLADGDRDEAEEVWRQLSAMVDRTPDVVLQLWPLEERTLRLTLDGNLLDALQTAEELAEKGIEIGSPQVASDASAYLSLNPALYLGRGVEAFGSLRLFG